MLTNIRFIDCDSSEALEAHIRQKVEKLTAAFDWIETANVIIRQGKSDDGKRLTAEIEVHALRQQLFAEESNADAYMASDGAIEKMKKQLEKIKTKITSNRNGVEE